MSAPGTTAVYTLVDPVELAHLRAVRDEALAVMDRVDEHQRKGWERVAVGAFDRLRSVLDGQAS